MLNLLPPQNKIAVRKEYIYRRAVIWLVLLNIVLFVSLVLVFPTYFISRIRASEIGTELEASKRALDAKLPPDQVMQELKVAIKNVDDLRPFVKPLSVYELVRIFESKPTTIKISGINFRKSDEIGSTILVSGIASDRESLTVFARSLESRVEFDSVTVPVSNFVKETNLDFTMEIKVKETNEK